MWASKKLQKYKSKGLIHALSSKKDGNLSFKRAFGAPRRKRREFFERLGIDVGRVVFMEAPHGFRVAKVKKAEKFARGVDGLYTFKPNIFLFGTFADCVPIFIYEPGSGFSGLIHAGWRGTVGEIAKKFIKAAKGEKVAPADILVAMGPHIKKCCFEVGEDVLELFGGEVKKSGFVDLSLALKKQFLNEGVKEKNIEVSTICTLCGNGYFSHRRKGNDSAMGAVIGVEKVIS